MTDYLGVSERQFRNIVQRRFERMLVEQIDFDPESSDDDFENVIQSDGSDDDSNIDLLEDNFVQDNDGQQYEEFDAINDYVEDANPRQHSFNLKVSNWYNKHGKLTREIGNEILVIFKEEFDLDIPVDMRAILKTPRTKIAIKPMDPGEYFHFGIENMLQKCNFNFLFDPNTNVCLDIGIDGLPLFKSSKINLWPIIARFVNMKKYPPFLVGVWSGRKQPKSCNEFLTDLATEIHTLTNNGVLVTRDKIRKSLIIRAFICDSVGRAFLKGTMGHSSVLGCQNCNLHNVETPNRRTFPTVSGPLRTDDSFQRRSENNHHHTEFQDEYSHILENCGVGMVSQFPLDAMHQFDLGVGKRILTEMYSGHPYGFKMPPQIQLNLNIRIKALSALAPKEFGRNPRSFTDLGLWKAAEFRQVLLYTGIVLLKDFVNADLYFHFLQLFCGYRLISHPTDASLNVPAAKILLDDFVTNYPAMYGENKVSFNVHNLLHITDYVSLYGCVDSFSAYPYENYLQEMKKVVHKPQLILQQIYNRFTERTQCNDLCQLENFLDPITGCAPFDGCHSSFRGYKFDQFILMNNECDCCCAIDNNIFFEIGEFALRNEEKIVIGRRYLSIGSFFEAPMNSLDDLGIAYCKDLNNQFEIFELSRITSKFYRIPYGEGYVLIPLLHM
jgi:hypothetical protein